jgi:hypothetical protein
MHVQMAKTRLKNLFELVDVRGSGEATDTSGVSERSAGNLQGAGSSHDPVVL